jgi:hypothetical protein
MIMPENNPHIHRVIDPAETFLNNRIIENCG